MRITFVLPFAALTGGVRVIATYARVLAEQGHEVFVVSPHKSRRGEWRKLWLRLTGRGHRVKNKQANPLLQELGARHIQYDPDQPLDPAIVPEADALFATWWRTAPLVAGLPAEKGAKFYLLQDYELYPPHPEDELVATYHLPMHKIAVSSYIRNIISKNHGVNGIEVVPNAVDQAQFATPPRGKQPVPTVGFLYNTHPRKRVSLAIDAVKLARQQRPDLKVLAFGGFDPTERAPLPDWVDYIRAPAQTEIPEIYAACDAWLFPTEREGFGLPILEAMASRTPVIATPAGGAPDLIDGINGSLLPADIDAEGFCAEILRFIDMEEAEWRRHSEAAQATAARNDWPHAARNLVATIEAMQAGEGAKP